MPGGFPIGYRFYPTEEELLSFYLKNKLDGNREAQIDRIIPLVDIYSYDPWQLPARAAEANIGDGEQWFFFVRIQERETHGGRPNRIAPSGYWKATGTPGYVYSSNNGVIGLRKSLVFYTGRAPYGRKTKWKMNEYKLRIVETNGDDVASSSSHGATTFAVRREMSLCRIYVKSGVLRQFDRRPPVIPAIQEPGPGPSSSTWTENPNQQPTNEMIDDNVSEGLNLDRDEAGTWDPMADDFAYWELMDDEIVNLESWNSI
ncbi:hypothetical protein AMTRI_Chr11g151070 [Amborella trichopoda]|uniref:NAC domain-containing protein n=1 Tax=Amborella trichopoda TaxID=13333 RepID=W1PXQ0_AMBTC|nr:NAC domain-containing protein 90 [Amborella trichopoda]ERN13043.1 hypothetical protein AMTR_s00040p00117430 [Amborella trichopoda]|eukprot:XP_020527255.1 NAC domain-containing protein 90 [Amborella trichopoda]